MLITLNMDIISQPKFSVIYFIQVYMELFFTPNTSLIWKPKELITSKKNNLCKITTRKPYIYIIIIFTLKLIFLSWWNLFFIYPNYKSKMKDMCEKIYAILSIDIKEKNITTFGIIKLFFYSVIYYFLSIQMILLIIMNYLLLQSLLYNSRKGGMSLQYS